MKRRIITCVALLLLTVFVGVLFFTVLNNAVSQLPNATQINYKKNSDFYPITISNWNEYRKRISERGITFCSELKECQIKGTTVTPVLTNEYYFEVMNIPLQGTLPKNQKAAVISSDLELKLFFKTNIIGKKIVINKEEYEISGVYENPKGFINEYSADGKERVYLYYTDYPLYQSQEIGMLCYNNDAPSAPLIEQMNLNQYLATNLGEKAKILINFQSVFFYGAVSLICVDCTENLV